MLAASPSFYSEISQGASSFFCKLFLSFQVDLNFVLMDYVTASSIYVDEDCYIFHYVPPVCDDSLICYSRGLFSRPFPALHLSKNAFIYRGNDFQQSLAGFLIFHFVHLCHNSQPWSLASFIFIFNIMTTREHIIVN